VSDVSSFHLPYSSGMNGIDLPRRLRIRPVPHFATVESRKTPFRAYSAPIERQIALLRGINIGSKNRVPMPALRELLTDVGWRDVRTYVQSGNVVLSTDLSPRELERECERLITEGFGLKIAVLARTRDELEQVVQRNPLGDVAVDPKRYQVSFLSAELEPATVEKLSALAAPQERFVADGRELYVWHPDGVARSKLWNRLASTGLGVTATARNWTTVTTLLTMADE
jgi:uncharacterized protein (DUF1697 family)